MPATQEKLIQYETKGVVVRLARDFYPVNESNTARKSFVITSIPNLNNLQSHAKRPGHLSWKIGDIMQGRVVGSGKGNSIVNIGGSNYWLNSPLQFTQGESLMLKVAGLTPMVHFSLVNRIRKNVGNSEAAAMTASDKLLQNFKGPDRSLNNNLTSLINLLHFSSSQPLPQATLELIDSLRRRLLKSGGLTNPGLIRYSILNGSLATTGQDASGGAKTIDNGLQSLLHQIADSLTVHRGTVGKLPVMGNYQHALGLSLYQSNDEDFLRNFTRKVEEQYLNLANSKPKTQDEMQLQPYRLFVELPVVFKNHVRSISIRFTGKKRGESKDSKEDVCSAEFEFELLSYGFVFTRISILGTKVSYLIGCEDERAAIHLGRCEDALVEALDAYGLTLDTYHCDVKKGHLSPDPSLRQRLQPSDTKHSVPLQDRPDPAVTDEALRKSLHEAHEQGQMPALDEFKLELNNQTVPLDREIPVELYCAMAGLFGQLLEVERL